MSCIFCKIVAGEIPSPKLFEDERFIAIKDLHPQAQFHALVIPKKHIVSLDEAFPAEGAGDSKLIGDLMATGTKVAREQGLLPAGFRSVINTGAGGGQSVFHLHLHVLGGGPMSGRFGS